MRASIRAGFKVFMDRKNLTVAFWNVLPAVFFPAIFLFSLRNFLSSGAELEASHFFLMTELALTTYFFLFRHKASTVSWHPFDVAVAMLGTFSPYLFSLNPGGAGHSLGLVLQLAGLTGIIVSTLSLNRSLGILPANRGIRTGGLYRIVRHPLYAGYQIAHIGFLMNHFNVRNVLVALICLCAEIQRIYAEEKHLSRDPAYRDFCQKVRWRLIPFIF